MELDLQRLRENIREATTEDLLDRLTVYRAGMEEEALVWIEGELANRGVKQHQIEAHAEERDRSVLWTEAGVAVRCSFCERPAVKRCWRWHRLWGKVPLFPRPVNLCVVHLT